MNEVIVRGVESNLADRMSWHLVAKVALKGVFAINVKIHLGMN